MYNGEDPTACEEWLEKLETAYQTGRRDIRDIVITCAEGPVLEVINSMQEDEEWPVLRDEIRRCFSDNKTPFHAAALLEDFPAQGPNQNLRAFLYKYMKLHKMATNIQARYDYDLRQKLHFLKRLRNTKIANKKGRSAEFKNYDNFSLAMCFGQALDMEGEFQVGEKCVPGEDPRIMVVDVAQMSDAEICNLIRGHTLVTPSPPMGIQMKLNPNPCFQCRLPGHKATNCLYVQKDKVPEIGGKIHHFMETYTPVDKELWSDFFNKCVKAQTAKKFRRYRKKFQGAVTAAQTSTTSALPQTQMKTTTPISPPSQKIPKKVTFAPQNTSEAKVTQQGDLKVKVLLVIPATIAHPTPKTRTTKVKKEINEIDKQSPMEPPALTQEEQNILQDLEKAGYFQPSDTEGETEPEESDNSESETE